MKAVTTENGLVVTINGELSATTVPQLAKNNRRLIERNSKLVFDLAGVTFSDNTGVALLIVLTSFAKNLGKELLFFNLPPQLLDLIEAVKVKELLPIK